MIASAPFVFVAGFVGTVLVHELGHVAAAALLRVRWRFVVSKRGPGVRIGTDAIALAPWQIVVTASGGPLGNLALAAIAFRLGQPLIVLMGLEFAVVNLLPFPHSDGSRMLHPRRALDSAKRKATAARSKALSA